MKMEFSVEAPCAGKVLQVFCREGSQVSAGQDLVVLETAA
jgi:urea carboxylase